MPGIIRTRCRRAEVQPFSLFLLVAVADDSQNLLERERGWLRPSLDP
jgi:hypothetical protein